MANLSSSIWRLAKRARSSPRLFPTFSHISPRLLSQSHGPFQKQTKKPSFVPSPEQRKVVELCATQNVVVSARPGSGKTATAEAIVATYPDKRVAVLTYSKRLQLETRRRLRPYSNCHVFTFHGMAGSLFDTVVNNDAKLLKLRNEVRRCNKLPQWKSASFDIVVLDEFQDCTPVLFWLVSCFLLANKKKMVGKSARLVVLGDERQSIYRFRGADQRYLTMAPKLLKSVTTDPFVEVSLSQSFRLSKETVQFINDAFLGGERYIIGSKSGPKPIVLKCDPYDSSAVAKRLSTLIQHYGAENSAMISPYLRRNLQLQSVTNILSERYHVPISPSIYDEAPLDDRVTYRKMCVSSIHQFKGSERDLVIVFGIDASFFTLLGRDLPDDRCPNEVFVALTRAATQLVLIHDDRKDLMSFVSAEALSDTAEIIHATGGQVEDAPDNAPRRALQLGLALPTSIGVRDIARHVGDGNLCEIIKAELCIRHLSPRLPKDERIVMPGVVLSDRRKKFHEVVSDLNGLVVVAAFEHNLIGTLNTLSTSKNGIDDSTPPVCPQEYASWLCRRACHYEAKLSGYKPRSIQMRRHKFDWIDPDDLALARSRLQEELKGSIKNLKFEYEVKQDLSVGNQKTQLGGRADIVTITSSSDYSAGENIDTVWEIKFVSQLTNEHIIQACAYAFLLGSQSGKVPRVLLYNVRDGQKLEITACNGLEGLRCVIERVLRLKYTAKGEAKDHEFLERCTKATQELLDLADPERGKDSVYQQRMHVHK